MHMQQQKKQKSDVMNALDMVKTGYMKENYQERKEKDEQKMHDFRTNKNGHRNDGTYRGLSTGRSW